MTEQANPTPSTVTLQMPPRTSLVAEAIGRLATAGVRSQLLNVDEWTMHDLGMRLTDRSLTVAAAHRWINQELGAAEGSEVIDDNAVYRFAEHFRRIYGQVEAEHRHRIARLTVEHATDGNIQAMTRVARARLASLVAERLVDANSVEDIESSLPRLAAAINDAERMAFDTQQLQLKQAEGERKQLKLEADLQTANLRAQELQRKLDEASAKFRQAVDAKAEQNATQGKQLTREDVYELLDKVMKGEA